MNRYYIKMSVNFEGEIDADSKEEAEQKAYSGWGENSDALVPYEGVNSIHADDLGELCEECDQVLDECDCERDEEEDEAE